MNGPAIVNNMQEHQICSREYFPSNALFTPVWVKLYKLDFPAVLGKDFVFLNNQRWTTWQLPRGEANASS